MPPKRNAATVRDNSSTKTGINSQLANMNSSKSKPLTRQAQQSTPTPAPSSASVNGSSTLFSSPFSFDVNTLADKSTEIKPFLLQVEKAFTEKIERLKAEFQQQITDLHSSVSQLLLNGFSNKQYDELDKRLDILERNQQANKLIIDGIPFSCRDSSNPSQVLDALCSSINTSVPSHDEIYFSKRGSSGCCSVIVKLRDLSDKSKILKATKAKIKTKGGKPLSLRDVGVDSEQPIYVHESLTRRNYKIFREASKIKKSLKFSSVFTINGGVFIRLNDSSGPLRINSLDELRAINCKPDAANGAKSS